MCHFLQGYVGKKFSEKYSFFNPVLFFFFCSSLFSYLQGFKDYLNAHQYKLMTLSEYKGVLESVGFVNVSAKSITDDIIDFTNRDMERFAEIRYGRSSHLK